MATYKSVYERYGSSNITGLDQSPRTYAYRAGDTFPAVAADQYQTIYDSELWRQIAEANGIDDLEAVTPGQILVIPSPTPSTN